MPVAVIEPETAGTTGRRRAPHSLGPIGDSGSPGLGRLAGLCDEDSDSFRIVDPGAFSGSRLNGVEKGRTIVGLDGTLEEVPRHMYVKCWEETGRGRKADTQFDWHQQK